MRPRAPTLSLIALVTLTLTLTARASPGPGPRLGFAPFASAHVGDRVEYRISSTDLTRADVGNDRFEVRSVTETVELEGTDPAGQVVSRFSVRKDETDPRELLRAFGMALPASATLTVTAAASVKIEDAEHPAEVVHASWASGDEEDYECDFFFSPDVPAGGLALARSVSREHGERAWTRVTVIAPVSMKRAER